MFGFLKKRLRKEHLRMVSDSAQMAKRLHRLYRRHEELTQDSESAQMAEALSELMQELEQLDRWLEVNDVLPPGKERELMEVHSGLSIQIQQAEDGRAEAARWIE